MLDAPVEKWKLGSPEGRWVGFGPYYAIFPVSFAQEIISRFSAEGDTVIDPFCGRGTTNYVSQLLNRNSVGIDINSVGWIFAKVKTDPAKQLNRLVSRVEEIGDLRCLNDYHPETEFEEWAWCPDVLAFIKSARRNLNWRKSKIDRTIASILLVYLHAKIGNGLSNQMRQSKSLAPDYSVRWWKDRMFRPPEIDAVAFLKSRVSWRYSKGLPKSGVKSSIYYGDCRHWLKRYEGPKASLVLTSPPYCGVTNYEYDNWIRLWALGGPNYPISNTKHRYSDKREYQQLINETFCELREKTTASATIVVRTDARDFTLETSLNAIKANWPSHKIYRRETKSIHPTQTALFGDKQIKPGEVDIIASNSETSLLDGFFKCTTKISG